MKNQFVSVDIALKLKELGFNGHCMGVYEFGTWTLKYYPQGVDKNKKIHHETLAPLWQQVTYWLREKHKTDITVITEWGPITGRTYKVGFSFVKDNKVDIWFSTDSDGMPISYKTYEEALEVALIESLKLI